MREVFWNTATGVLPAFLVIFIGAFLHRLGFFGKQTKDDIIRLIFYVGTPALIIRQLVAADFSRLFNPRFLLYLLLISLLLVALAIALSWFIKDPRKKGAVVQIAFRANIAIIGLPIAAGLMDAQGVSLMALSLALMIPLYNILVVIILSHYGTPGQRLGQTLLNIARNPLILAVVVGILLKWSGIPMGGTSVQYQVLNYLGQIAQVMGLLVIGTEIKLRGMRADRGYVLYSIFLRNVLSPVLLLVPAIWLGFRGNELLVLAVIGAAPPAINCYVMAKQMGVCTNVTAYSISLSTLVSIFSVFVSVFVLHAAGLA
ncbi:MAG: AEC family transporter [Eubacteriales bacterium]